MAQPPLPSGFTLQSGPPRDPNLLKPLFDLGIEPTNGYRAPGDTQRLKREGYTPANNSGHLVGDDVDLTPGKSGLSLAQLQARANAIASAWPGGKAEIHNGSHVHLALPGWGMAPGTPGTPNFGLPPLPPGYALAQRGSLSSSQGGMFAPQRTAFKAAPALTPLSLTGQAHDGDTVRLTDGRNGRLLGFDAFELNQQGRRADGSLVPLGVQGRDFMRSRIGPGMSAFPTGSQTYGRPVVNLSQDPMTDPAHDALRLGFGTAEPQYLKGTPQLTPYMEAERLARLNQLGGFQTNAETPSQFRHKDGPWQGATPGVYGQGQAQFFDDPSPFYGLRPEVADAYRAAALKAKTPEEVRAAAQSLGLDVPLSAAKTWLEQRDKAGGHVAAGVNYLFPPRPTIDPGDGAFGSYARGFGDPFNALDETGGIVDALGATPGRQNIFNAPPGTRFGDVLWNNIDQNRAILAHDEEAHPYARIGGQLTSGVALPMGVASTPLRLGGIMAAEGGLAGLMAGEGDIKARIPNAALGTVAGAALGPALGLAGEHLIGPLVQRGLARFRRGSEGVAADAANDLPPLPEGFSVRPPNDYRSAAMADENAPPEVVGPIERPRDYLNVNELPPPPGFRLSVQPGAAERARGVSAMTPETVIQPIDNSVSTLDEALKANPSRFQDLQAPDEFQALGVRTVTTPTGGKVRVRGPLDITQTIRLMGGLKNDGGDLAHLGITNAPRRMPFGSNEQFLGRLVHDEGRPLDEVAHALWEQGYLPDFQERPTPNDLLDVLRSEAFGDRRFHPDDFEEIANFHAAQAERGAIDDAAASGSPLADDPSQPVSLDDILKMTVPDYAYMNPAGNRIGNLNLSKIEGSDDLAAAMQHIEAALGDHPLQASVTNEQTKAAAHELGMSVDDFLRTHPGQMDGKRLIAGRMMLHGALEATRRAALKVVKGGTDTDKLAFERAKFVTALIQDHMKAATAEAGRTLQALKIVSTKGDAARMAAVRQVIRDRGGHDRITDSAQEFLDVVADPAKANRFIAKDTKATWLQMFNEGVTMARLSNPVTHVRNFLGNAGAAAISFPETALEAGLGKLFNSPDRSYISEVGARASGIASALPDAMRNMAKVFRTGEPIDGVTKIEAQLNYKAIPGRAGEIVRIPGRAMTAADEAWKTLIYADHINALARRNSIRSGLQGEDRAALEAQLRHNPTAEMLDSAKIEARYRTFQQELGQWGKSLQTISNTWPGAKILLTFVRTPINLVKFAGERSAFGLAMPSVIRKLAQGGRARDEALSRIIVGSTISTGATLAALHGRVSGSGPDDPRQKAALMQTGWRPNSIRVGDKWVSFQGLDPVSTLVAVSADFAQAGQWASPKERQSIATNLALSAAESASNRTWMGGVADFFDALHDPKHNAAPFLKQQAAGLVPAGLGQATAYTDPYLRNAQTTLQAIKARIPYLSNSLPVRRDVWGDPIARDQALGPDILSPFRYGQATNDPVNNEIARLRVPLQKPQRLLTVAGQSVALSDKQLDEYIQLSGKPAKAAIAKEMHSPEWQQMSDDDKRDEVKSILADMRDAARDELRSRYPELSRESSGAPASPFPPNARPGAGPPPPPGFQAAPPLPPGFRLAN